MQQVVFNAFSGFRSRATHNASPQTLSQGERKPPDMREIDYYAGMVQATDDTFEKQVLDASWRKPTLVHFYNKDCGDCSNLLDEMRPIAESMSPGGSIKFVKIEDEWNPEASERFATQTPINLSIASLREDEEEGLRINSHPLVLFRYGEVMDDMNCNDKHNRLERLIRETVRKEDLKLFPKPQPKPDSDASKPSQGWVAWVKSLLGLQAGATAPQPAK